MTKEEIRQKLIEAGDAIVTYRGENSSKLKYNVVTLDFSTPYIKERRTHARESDNTILAFAWDTDAFRLVRTDLIVTIQPLANVLKNHV